MTKAGFGDYSWHWAVGGMSGTVRVELSECNVTNRQVTRQTSSCALEISRRVQSDHTNRLPTNNTVFFSLTLSQLVTVATP